VIPSRGDTLMKVKNCVAEFYKLGRRESGERMGVVTMTKKVVNFFRKNRATPSVTATADTNPSDATVYCA